MKASTEILRRVHDESEAVFLEIGENGDSPEFLELRTTNENNIKWYGNVSIMMSPDFAIELGSAILNAGIEKKQHESKQ